jgi:hypothetical protein
MSVVAETNEKVGDYCVRLTEEATKNNCRVEGCLIGCVWLPFLVYRPVS